MLKISQIFKTFLYYFTHHLIPAGQIRTFSSGTIYNDTSTVQYINCMVYGTVYQLHLFV